MKNEKINYNQKIDNDCVEIVPFTQKVYVSAFKNCYTPQPAAYGKLIYWLVMTRFKDRVIAYRKCKDPQKRQAIKRNLPAITPSGLFRGKRCKENLFRHSCMVCIDIDADPNNPRSGTEWHKQIKIIADHFDSLVYGGLSLSGHGIYLIFRIADPTKHWEHLNSLMIEIENLTGLKADRSCMDVTRLRIVSYDRQAYLNTQAKAYSKTVNREYEISLQQIYSERPVSSKTVAERHKTYERVIILIHKLKRKRIDITRNYNEWFDIGCSLASEYGVKGLPLFQAVSSLHPNYDPDKCAKQYRQCLKHNYKKIQIATFFYICQKYGVTFK